MVVFGTRISGTLGDCGGERPRLKLGLRPKMQHERNMFAVSLQPYGKNLDCP